jgi:hypothetical protein
VLQERANRGCGTPFRYLHQGKLLEIKTQYRSSPGSEAERNPKNGTGYIQRYWLCAHCAAHVTLFFDRQHGLTMAGSLPDSKDVIKTVFPRPNGRNVPEISRILIRRLDIDSTMARNGDRPTREAA